MKNKKKSGEKTKKNLGKKSKKKKIMGKTAKNVEKIMKLGIIPGKIPGTNNRQ